MFELEITILHAKTLQFHLVPLCYYPEVFEQGNGKLCLIVNRHLSSNLCGATCTGNYPPHTLVTVYKDI